MKGKASLISSFLVFFCLLSLAVVAQPSWTFNLFNNNEKPKEYEERVLPSEKTADKKFNLVRRFIHNNTTHFNYYFNAKAKLNTVIERAKLAQKDDYTRLLSFYPYSLDNTASQQVELDSVIYKATAGILLHDLRSDWVDNLYLLIGQSYFHRKTFDSAALTFQFINYNLFPRKKKEDDNRTVGGGTSLSGFMSIADEEKRNILKKVVSLPPSRNDALVWIIRTFIEQDAYADAAGLINILQSDPNLPKRLKDDINEVKAYWFFKQNIYDSAAVFLEKGLSNFDNKADRSREEYLLAQLYAMTRQFDKAHQYYTLASKKTTDPLMDIYANLYQATMLRNAGDDKELSVSISNLLSMAKKDKYEAYRDIIYNNAAELSLLKKDTASALSCLQKSLKYNSQNPTAKNKSHYELGKIAYVRSEYVDAADHYDSIDVTDPALSSDSLQIVSKKSSLRRLADQAKIVAHEDSVQRIALMPPAERDVFIKKLSKKLRKEKGSGEVEDIIPSMLLTSQDKAAPTDLFQSSSKGEWYFYNTSMKSKGFGEFKNKWGKRENKDNWRRKAVMNMVVNDNINIDDPSLGAETANNTGEGKPVENSYDALMLGLPLTPENVDSSNQRIARALTQMGQIFDFEFEEYFQAIDAYDDYLKRFPEGQEKTEVYAGLHHCYTKLGDRQNAERYKKLSGAQDADAGLKKSQPSAAEKAKTDAEAAATYQSIYNQFIEGNFDKAIADKKTADSIYGKNFWSPQLLYIEAVYYVKARKDSQAVLVLNSIVSDYPNTPMSEKAATMVEVLKKRADIESYLTKLEITRVEEEKVIITDSKPAETAKPAAVAIPSLPAVKKIEPIKTAPLINDSLIQMPASLVSEGYKWQPLKPHLLLMVLNKVDIVYQNEARNALARYNREKNYTSINIVKDVIDNDNAILVFNSFENADVALAYYEKLKKSVGSEISWLQPSKYSFLIITNENLQLLKTKKDKDVYRQLLNNQYPNKF